MLVCALYINNYSVAQNRHYLSTRSIHVAAMPTLGTSLDIGGFLLQEVDEQLGAYEIVEDMHSTSLVAPQSTVKSSSPGCPTLMPLC